MTEVTDNPIVLELSDFAEPLPPQTREVLICVHGERERVHVFGWNVNVHIHWVSSLVDDVSPHGRKTVCGQRCVGFRCLGVALEADVPGEHLERVNFRLAGGASHCDFLPVSLFLCVAIDADLIALLVAVHARWDFLTAAGAVPILWCVMRCDAWVPCDPHLLPPLTWSG